MLATVWNLKINIKSWNRWGCQGACHEKLANLFLNWNHCACLGGQGSACSRHSSSLSFIHHHSPSFSFYPVFTPLASRLSCRACPHISLPDFILVLLLSYSFLHGYKYWIEQCFCRKSSQPWEHCECFILKSKIESLVFCFCFFVDKIVAWHNITIL